MLHVLLLILKITGIVIACILGLVILVVTAVLFVPVRYKVNADYHDRFKAQAKVSWLGILRLMISYDEELDIKAKAFFITVYNNNDENSKVSEQKKANKKKEKKPEENIFSASDKDVEKLTEKEEKPQIKMAEAVNETKEDVQNVKEAVSEDESGNIQNRSFFNKVKDKCFVIYTKIKEIIKLIRDTVKKISGAADRLKEKVSKAKEFVTDEDNKALFHFLVEQLKALIKVIKPKKYRINARIGFEDPATMGKVLAYVSILYGMSGVDLSLEPVFGENVKEGSMFLKGNICIFSVLVIALRLYRNEQFKKFISR
ncbi:DUF2953 domain-containing protein [Eubacterium sp. AM46-8]|uniref:DUF2953 domain-containing protein n=1 Tax=Eubacterium sp. AM46-8 TaxID=2292350 RepID=UPI000E54E23D|nr:DUF2953 domain-containing protein [Eubacterium sp. AM46-8]RGZ91833.1 DUF2953 domain-containing protein [Eubacterium sp. AM46-8]